MSSGRAVSTRATVAASGDSVDRCRRQRGDERWLDDAWRRGRVLAAADWFTRRRIAAALAGAPVETDAGGLLAPPPRASMAWSLLTDWVRAG